MHIKQILRNLDLGNSVAERDVSLEKYFVETETFRALVTNRVDIVAGDKGTGKTAIYSILQKRYTEIPALNDVQIVPGFNVSGSSVFQRLTQTSALNEGQYITVWKAYILSLIGNWILESTQETLSTKAKELDNLLTRMGLRTIDSSPKTVFSKLINALNRIMNPEAAQVKVEVTQDGFPIVTPRVEFGATTLDEQTVEIIRHEEALALLNTTLEEAGLSIWLVLDRLDEAFQGFPNTEIPALRALLRTYLDLQNELPRISLKLFLRKDLFRRIIQGGFVNLTHVNAKKIEIVWDDEDLLNLLCLRIRDNNSLINDLGAEGTSNQELFDLVFPKQIAVGQKRPTSWLWITSRIRDANGIKPPRNLIDLIRKAREAQLRREEREERVFESGKPLFEPESVKRAHIALSQERVEDTLLAEAGEHASYIERFRDGKAEHNEHSLIDLLGVERKEIKAIIRSLMELGFLEQIGDSYKVPILYRDGLSITQGKAF